MASRVKQKHVAVLVAAFRDRTLVTPSDHTTKRFVFAEVATRFDGRAQRQWEDLEYDDLPTTWHLA